MNTAAPTTRRRPFLTGLALIGVSLLPMAACDEGQDFEADALAEDAQTEFRSDNLILAMTAIEMTKEEIQASDQMDEETLHMRLQEIFVEVPWDQLTEQERAEVDQMVVMFAEELAPIAQAFPPPAPDPDVDPNATELCYTKCFIIFEYSCETGQFLGLCPDPGYWGCAAQNGEHECVGQGEPGGSGDPGEPDPGEACGSDFCGEGERCAKWVHKPHECVRTCDDDADCNPGESCDKPWGTSFHRCR